MTNTPPKASRVLVCGNRNARPTPGFLGLIKNTLIDIEADVVITGACRGVDSIAEGVARELELAYIGDPARWSKEGRAAGPIRNQRMLDRWSPDLVLGFHSNIAHSKGTADMLIRAVESRITTWLHDGNKWNLRQI